MNFKTTFLLMILLVFSACNIQKKSKVNPRENLNTAIVYAIQLFKNKDYKSFLENYVLPEDLEVILQKMTMEDFVKKFAEKKAEKVLNALKSAKEISPEYDESGTIAIFSKDKVGMHKDMVFKKVEKYWYLAN